MQKRTAGEPLSEAELEQRKNAAKARWAAAGVAAGVGAVAGLHQLTQRNVVQLDRAQNISQAAINRGQFVEARLRQRAVAARVKPAQADKKFFQAAGKVLNAKARLAVRDLRAVSPPAESVILGTGEVIQAVPHIEVMDAPAQRLRDIREQLRAFKKNGRLTRKVPRQGTETYRVPAQQRTVKVFGPTWTANADHKLQAVLQEAGLPHDPVTTRPTRPASRGGRPAETVEQYARFVKDRALNPHAAEDGFHSFASTAKTLKANNIKGIADLTAYLKTLPEPDRKRFLTEHSLPGVTSMTTNKTVPVRAHVSQRGPDRMTIEGFPEKPARQALAAQLNSEIQQAHDTLLAREISAGKWRRALANMQARRLSYIPARRLPYIKAARAGAIGITGLSAAIAAYYYAKRSGAESNKVALTKVWSPTEHPRGADGQFARADDPPRVTMLIGLPGAGKSTWRRNNLPIRPTTVISTDDKVDFVAKARGVTYDQAYKLMNFDQVEKEQKEAIHAAVTSGQDVLVDRVNASPKGREKTLRIIPRHYERHAVVFNVPHKELVRRRAGRTGKTIPRNVLKEMETAFKPPEPNEFDYVHTQHYVARSGGKSNNRLNKSDDAPTLEANLRAAGVFEAGSAVEASLASRIAKALTGLKDDVAERLGQARGGTIHETMITDLDRAMRPLDTAMQAGADVSPQADDPNAHEIALTMQARSPLPEAFVQSYRLDRVRELAGDQRDAIKAVLLSAARDGAPPAEMARRIRQTVGLTAHQAGLVLNYRRQLETGSPQALTRALRDKRYDGQVTQAIAGKKLTTQQLDKITDAYHRRFLAYRATTIARTEGLRAANAGHMAGVEQMLQQYPDMDVVKTWIATNDSRTRHDHRSLNGKSVVGLATPFIADDGSQILYPHDPDAPANQTVGCRCACATSLIPKRGRV